ncbi:hypothetical protein [Oscillibacter sp.]|jgi:hypothetical protein|uniref:hypothetical protein n=1 Tax=Oscillibacter sp. TaxID=1945593 RepID=UPI0025F630B8|nr:hypothetical protein [Oscillibacter sp.]
MLFKSRKLTETASMEEQVRIREALAGAGIACSVRAWGTARAVERRGRIGGTPERGEITYSIRVRRNDYDRAAGVLSSLRRGC